jgi:hypothetical protein
VPGPRDHRAEHPFTAREVCMRMLSGLGRDSGLGFACGVGPSGGCQVVVEHGDIWSKAPRLR